MLRIADKQEAYVIAASLQDASRCHSVRAIVSGAAHSQDPGFFPQIPLFRHMLCGLRHSQGSPLHKHHGRNADVFYGILVNRFHLLCRYCVIHIPSPL